MNEDIRRECTPQDYIRKLFHETKDGKLKIHYFPFLDQPYSSTYRMDWIKNDAETMVERYNTLTSALTRIGELHGELEDEAKRKELLSSEELNVWDTYIRPFEPFEVDSDIISELRFRSETESLDDEDCELLERHHDWFVANSHKRLPADRWCPSHLINRAQRYTKLIELGAPDVVVEEEGRFLAEEMVLYYHATKEISLDSLKFIMAQSRVYEKALQEIKNGKKKTHWMWFIFPQLRGLGRSEMAQTYAIADLDEAEAYLKHNVLGARLIEISEALLNINEIDPKVILGDIDAMKLKSCMTLFSVVSEENSVFHKVLEKFFDGQTDAKTLELLANQE